MGIINSKSEYFHNATAEDRQTLIVYLRDVWKYKPEEVDIYLVAFDHFLECPDDFDGATWTEELFDIPGLDIDAMLHDYLYSALKASVSWKYQVRADQLLSNEMKRRRKSSWNRGYRFTALTISTPIWIPYCWFWKGRRITKGDKVKMDYIFNTIGQ